VAFTRPLPLASGSGRKIFQGTTRVGLALIFSPQFRNASPPGEPRNIPVPACVDGLARNQGWATDGAFRHACKARRRGCTNDTFRRGLCGFFRGMRSGRTRTRQKCGGPDIGADRPIGARVCGCCRPQRTPGKRDQGRHVALTFGQSMRVPAIWRAPLLFAWLSDGDWRALRDSNPCYRRERAMS
jgi:hypothetical protein